MNLVLFATYGSSLKTWSQAGILDRELALYKEHANLGANVHIITYGDSSDLELASPYDFITVHCNKYNLHPRLYALLLPFLHRKILKAASIIKSNQLYGAHVIKRCLQLYKKPFVARQGYGHYEHRVEEYSEDHPIAKQAFVYEASAYNKAQLITFTTKELADRAIQRHHLDNEKVKVVPNYIVPETWSPSFTPKTIGNRRLKLAFYGRYTEQKNLEALIHACNGLNVELTLIGEGPLESHLRELVENLDVNCEFLGRQTQENLKSILNKHDVFILPSHYEGHPKSLLETMAFGMPVLAANTPGIKEQIKDQETGILMEPTVESIRENITNFAKTPLDTRINLGKNAKSWAMKNFSVQSIAELEQSMYRNLI